MLLMFNNNMKNSLIAALSLTLSLFASVSTQALTPHRQSIHFGIIGDYGANSLSEKRVAKKLKTKNPEFIITLGDNNYLSGCASTIDENIGQYYSEYIGNYQGRYGEGAKVNRFYPALGNHDWNALSDCPVNGTLPYFDYFTLPGNQRYYDFVKGPVHFFAIDSDQHEPDGREMGSKQYLWLKAQLAKSTSPYNIVYFHHAPFSSGYHGSTKEMQWDFKKLGVTLVLAGHDHHYERIERDGMVYFVNGLGGSDFVLPPVGKVEGSKYKYFIQHGFMMGYADNNKLTLQFFNDSNKLLDTKVFTNTKAKK